MDYGNYRPSGSRVAPSRTAVPTIPVTITTGIPLSDRFRHMQAQQETIHSFAQEGYGIPGASRYAGPAGYSAPTRGVPKTISQRNRALAVALARRSMGIGRRPSAPLVRSRGRPALPVKARLGIPRPLRGARPGGGLGLNRVQKTAGSIMRQRGGVVAQKLVRGGARLGGNSLKAAPQQRGVAPRRGQIVRGGRGGRGAPRGNPRGGARGGTRGGARGGVRGGARGVGRGGNRGGATVGNKPVSREDLDSELEQYMSKSKSYLDKQLDDYMLQAKAAAAAISAGTVVVEDVNMTMEA